jgi:hypothetical protein
VRLRPPAPAVTRVLSQPTVSGHPSKLCREVPLFLTVTASTQCYQPSPACYDTLWLTRMEEQADRYVPPNWRNVAGVSTSRALRELPHGARAARRSPLLAITPLEAFHAPAPAWGTLSPNTPWRFKRHRGETQKVVSEAGKAGVQPALPDHLPGWLPLHVFLGRSLASVACLRFSGAC